MYKENDKSSSAVLKHFFLEIVDHQTRVTQQNDYDTFGSLDNAQRAPINDAFSS